MQKFIDKVFTDNSEDFNELDPNDSTDLFWKLYNDNLVSDRVTFIDEDFPDSYGWDWYDLMMDARSKWWKDICEIGERPYNIFFVKGDTLLNYIEWDLLYYKLNND